MLTTTQIAIRWFVIVAIFLLSFYWFRSIIAPYIIGVTLAYFLDPVADRLEKYGFKRIIAVTIITLIALGAILIILLIAVPLAFEQLMELIANLPGFFQTANEILLSRFPSFAEFESGLLERISASTSTIVTTVSDWLINRTASLFNIIAAVFIIPTVAFYMLYDWDRVTRIVDSWVPRDNVPSYRYLMGEIDKTLSGFVRGQGSVCLIMATYYSIVLTLTGLNFGFVIGLIAGILTFIPIIGGLVGGMLVIGVGFFQYMLGDGWNWPHYMLILILYYGGQMFEGNLLTPRLVGNSVGLHPVWVMFSLSAGALVAGFTGMIVAVPVAAVVGVIGRYFMENYKKGPLYWGKEYDKYKASGKAKKLKDAPAKDG